MNRKKTIWTLAMVAAALAVAPSFAETYNLTACQFSKTIGASTIAMWGYANGGACTSPGPMLTVPPGDTTLTIILTNNLPVATSIVIPGLTTSFTPLRTADPQGRQRVRAFTTQAPASGGTATYTWTGVRPGTYIYHSGSFPALQVQMGLYGMMKKDAAPIAYTKEVILVYSEIDPLLPARQTTPNYTMTRGVAGYVPRYFLVNGQPYPDGLPIVSGPININDTVLIRLVNAGLKAHVPTLLGGYLSLVAEDANPYPYPKKQYSVNLPPLKTIDAIWVPTADGTYPLYDRSLDLTTNGTLGGGMLSKLVVGAVAGAPVAANDSYTVPEDQVGGLVVAAPGVLGNDSGTAPLTAVLFANAAHGTVVLNSDGSFTYTPVANYSGPDAFQYKAVSGVLESNVATVNIAVTPVNDPPVANPDSASTTAGTPVTINVLANDTDLDGDPLTVVLGAAVNGNAVLNANQTVTFTPSCAAPCTGSFTYQARDPSLALSAPATVTVTVGPAVNQPPVAVDDAAQTPQNVPVTINVVLNDSDPDGTINPTTVVLTGESGNPPAITTSQRGTAVNQKNGTVIYTPRRNFRGTDTFTYTVKDNQGVTSNTATVRVNVQ